MDGRKNLHRKFFFGFPQNLNTNLLPTESDIVSHTQYLKKEKNNSGEWRNNTPVSEIARVVVEDLCAVWDKTDIPHYGTLNPKWVRERVEKLLNRAKGVLKIPIDRRNNVDLEVEWSSLFDISLCSHKEKKICDCPDCSIPHPEPCNCGDGSRVPDGWTSFLWDQREKRQQGLSTIDRRKLIEERERLEKEQRTLERNQREEQSMETARMKSEMEVQTILAGASDSDLVDSQGNRLSDIETDTEADSDSDWEDDEENIPTTVNQRNRVSLRRFSRECDRYKQSNRGAAKLGNALLKDFGVVTQSNQTLLICPSKVKRERERWGQELVVQHSALVGPGTTLLQFLM